MLKPAMLTIVFSCFLVGCATERTAAGDPIESGTVNYEISEEELDAYISKDERVTFFGGFIPNDAIRAKFKMNLDRDQMQSFVIAALEDVGWVYKVRGNEPVVEIVGIVNSGLLNMNKSSFWIGLQRVGNDTLVSILAVAFEGLIKQNTNGKALERFILSLEEESGQKVELLKLDP